jgi:uncharacterized membrane protein YeaQ/YmgE (transglycosylase-associated protein family)
MLTRGALPVSTRYGFRMGFIAWIITGLIAGALAQRVTGYEKEGCVRRLALGVLGGMLGGFLATAVFNTERATRLGVKSVFFAFIGAVIISFFAGRFFGKKK